MASMRRLSKAAGVENPRVQIYSAGPDDTYPVQSTVAPPKAISIGATPAGRSCLCPSFMASTSLSA